LREATAGLSRFIVTCETAKHRTFTFLSRESRPEHKLVVLAHDDSFLLGCVSSVPHLIWATAAGATLEDRPVYVKSTCFERFPFPHEDTGLTPALTDRIRALAEQLDAHRKTQQAAHADLTLTGMYNVLQKLRFGEALNAKDKLIHGQGLVSVLKSLHDELDAAVLAAYGWADLQPALADHAHADARAAAVETLLERLVALNARRAAEEAAGTVRWLRPSFQQRGLGVQTSLAAESQDGVVALPEDAASASTTPAPAVPKRAWPAGLPEQIKAVAEVLATSGRALSLAELEARFNARGRWRDRLPTILDTLEALGRARRPQPGAERWQAA